MTLKTELTKIVELLERKFGGVTSLDRDNPLDQLIVLILASASNQKKADEALEGLRSRFVDWNEVRVTALHDIEKAIGSLGTKIVEGKASLIRDVLGAIYARFNKVDLDFFMEKSDKQNARRRERLLNYLAERSPALPALMTCYLEDRAATVQVTGSLARMVGRLGTFKKGSSPAKIRKDIESVLEPAERFVFLTGAWEVAESLCHRAQPDCRNCPLNKNCKTAPAEIDRAKKAEDAEREKNRREARKLAEKIARDARIAAKKADDVKKAEAKKAEAKKEAERKKAEAEKKKLAVKKAAEKTAEAKKKAAEKKAATKKAPAKKAAAKKVTKKPTTRAPAAAKAKPAAKKSTAKKTTTKPASKKSTKKPVTKRPASKKPVTKTTKSPGSKAKSKTKTSARKTGSRK